MGFGGACPSLPAPDDEWELDHPAGEDRDTVRQFREEIDDAALVAVRRRTRALVAVLDR